MYRRVRQQTYPLQECNVTIYCLSLLSRAVIKHWAEATWGGGVTYSLNHTQLITEGSQDKKSNRLAMFLFTVLDDR